MRNAQRADRVSLRSIRGALACVVQHQLYQFTIGGGCLRPESEPRPRPRNHRDSFITRVRRVPDSG